MENILVRTKIFINFFYICWAQTVLCNKKAAMLYVTNKKRVLL